MKSYTFWEIVAGLHSLTSQNTELFDFFYVYIVTVSIETTVRIEDCWLCAQTTKYVFKIFCINNGAQCICE
jgi:hypothetical protein